MKFGQENVAFRLEIMGGSEQSSNLLSANRSRNLKKIKIEDHSNLDRNIGFVFLKPKIYHETFIFLVSLLTRLFEFPVTFSFF